MAIPSLRGAKRLSACACALAALCDAPAAAAADAAPPLAGFHDGLFYLRDAGDNFRLYPRGRAQLDVYTYAGVGVPASALDDTLVFRRLQPEVSGEIGKRWAWTLGLAWQSASLGRPPGVTALAEEAAGVAKPRATGLRSIPADAFVDFAAADLLHLQLGQFDAPFTMENRTSDAVTPFLERSMVARDLGVPQNKGRGLMLWGGPEGGAARYEIATLLPDGAGGGGFHDGYDLMSHLVVHPGFFFPIANASSLGASYRVGWRNDHDRAPLRGFTTPANFELWAPVYATARGLMRAHPFGATTGQAYEGHLALLRVDGAIEWTSIHEGTREALDGSDVTLRRGELCGEAWYFHVGLWLYGKPDIAGKLGVEPLAHADLLAPERDRAQRAFQLIGRYDHLSAGYSGAARGGAPDRDGVDGAIRVSSWTTGMTLWWTRALRLSANYAVTWLPGDAPPGSPRQREMTPAQRGPGGDKVARDLHEVSLRVAAGL